MTVLAPFPVDDYTLDLLDEATRSGVDGGGPTPRQVRLFHSDHDERREVGDERYAESTSGPLRHPNSIFQALIAEIRRLRRLTRSRGAEIRRLRGEQP